MYTDKRAALKAAMATHCPRYWDHRFAPTIAVHHLRCRCGKVVNTDCSPVGVM